MSIDENHIDPLTIKRLLDEGYKVHSSAQGRVGDVKHVNADGSVILRDSKNYDYVTRFDRGEHVEIVPHSTDKKLMIIRGIVREVPQVDLFTAQTDADRRFEDFDKRNPQVYKQLVKLARELHHRGHKKIGIQMLIEVVRWQSLIRTEGDDFKINNNFGARYARKIMTENSDLDGIFDTRGLRS